MNRISAKFAQLRSKGEKAFVPYIMAGDGEPGSLRERITLLEAFGASAVEIGIPFSDPVADGPVIQQAGIRALQNGTTLNSVLEELSTFRTEIKIPLVVMTYLNPVLAYGIDNFARDAKAAGIDGCIIPDLPVEEEGLLAPSLETAEIELIRLVTLTTPPERMKNIVSRGNGFVYAVTVKGVTGGKGTFDGEELVQFLDSIKKVSPLPVLAGFGISEGSQAKKIAAHCDGVISGSAVVDFFAKGKLEEIKKLVSSLAKENEPAV